MTRAFSKFLPHPLLAGGHLQTLAGLYLPSRDGFEQTIMHQVSLPDGDRLVLHEDTPRDWTDGAPVCLLVHGLCGSHRSPYVRRLAWRLFERGVRTFRLDLRGNGAGEGLARSGTHCGRWRDLEPPIDYITQLAPNSPSTLIGYSLGGALVLSLAAELRSNQLGRWQQAIAVCPPVDLKAVEQFLQTPLSRNYDRYFTKRLWETTVRRAKTINGAPQVDHIPRPRRLREFDERLTAPLGGYTSADDYYEQASVADRLEQIEMRTLIVAANNDPIIPAEPMQRAQLSGSTELISTDCGGHLGFVGRTSADPDRRWVDWRILEWYFGASADKAPHANFRSQASMPL